jgi:NADPH2:quinone reductase
VVLVAGGAGAVGNAAIQLARWAGATVIGTVSSEAKAKLVTAAGAHHVVNYKDRDAAEQRRRVSPEGVDLIVEVAAGANADLDQTVLRPRGTISIYANDGGAPFDLDVRRNMGLNARYQFVLLYTVGWDRITAAAADINQAVEDGAFRVGEHVGCRFTASASKTRRPHTLPSSAEPSERSSSPSQADEQSPLMSGR